MEIELLEGLLRIIYEAWKALNKSDLERFENEWEKDRPLLVKALEAGDADAVNRLNAKYLSLSEA